MPMNYTRLKQRFALTGVIVCLIFTERLWNHFKPPSISLLRWEKSIPPILSTHHVRGMMCTLLKNEGRHVKEWISFHSLLGVDLFVIYDDNSIDDLLNEVREFQGRVIVIPWGLSSSGKDLDIHVQAERQVTAVQHCVSTYGSLPQWLIFCDVDEFIFPCKSDHDAIGEYIDEPAVQLECLKFGFGFEDRNLAPNELTIEKHLLRAPYYSLDENAQNLTKRFPIPSCQIDARMCETRGAWKNAYNVREYPQYRNILAQSISIHGAPVIPVTQETLTRESGICCNHYAFRSTQLASAKAKKNRNSIFDRVARNNDSAAFYNSVLDTKILRYFSELRKFLADPKLSIGKHSHEWADCRPPTCVFKHLMRLGVSICRRVCD